MRSIVADIFNLPKEETDGKNWMICIPTWKERHAKYISRSLRRMVWEIPGIHGYIEAQTKIYGDVPLCFPAVKLITFPIRISDRFGPNLNWASMNCPYLIEYTNRYNLDNVFFATDGLFGGRVTLEMALDVVEHGLGEDDRFVFVYYPKGYRWIPNLNDTDSSVIKNAW